MPIETSYTSLRANLSKVLDRIVDDQEAVIVRRKASRDVSLMPAAELAGLLETAHLFRSPANARRLLAALRRAERARMRPGNAADVRREILPAVPPRAAKTKKVAALPSFIRTQRIPELPWRATG
jgi:antitoxin YefM